MNIKVLLIALLFVNIHLYAEVLDKWKINVGSMYVTNFETEMQLTPQSSPVAAKINTKDQLGMKSDTYVFRLDGYYRFNNIHSIDFSYFGARSNGYKSIDESITWDDKEIDVSAIVNSYFNMDVYKVNYGYSFYHNNKVELMITAGLHITSIRLGISAKGTIDGIADEGYTSSSSLTAPLPVVGFKGEYTIINKRLFVKYRSEFFALKYDDYRGQLLSSALNLEYRFVDHVGIGLGYNTNKIYLKADDGAKKIEVINELTGALLYFSYIY